MFFDNEFSVDGKVCLNYLSHARGQLQSPAIHHFRVALTLMNDIYSALVSSLLDLHQLVQGELWE
jgi:hypothetical protein